MFLLFLPPLLYPAALFTSWRDFRANLRPISMLAIRLVLITTVIVGFVAHKLVGLPWAAAFALGAIVSPGRGSGNRDYQTTSSSTTDRHDYRRRKSRERRDGSCHLPVCSRRGRDGDVLVSVGWPGVYTRVFGRYFLGAVIGWLASVVQRRLDDPPVQTTLSLLTPFAAYLAADKAGASGVLAVVTAGLYLGWRSPEIINSRTRFQVFPVWEMVVFLLNGLIFILIGLQLPQIVENLSGQSLAKLCWQAGLLNLALILVRIALDFWGRAPSGSAWQSACEKHPTPELATHRHCGMDGYARRGFDGGRNGIAAVCQWRLAIPGARSDSISHIRRHPGNAACFRG